MNKTGNLMLCDVTLMRWLVSVCQLLYFLFNDSIRCWSLLGFVRFFFGSCVWLPLCLSKFLFRLSTKHATAIKVETKCIHEDRMFYEELLND